MENVIFVYRCMLRRDMSLVVCLVLCAEVGGTSKNESFLASAAKIQIHKQTYNLKQWRFYVGARRGAQPPPPNLAQAPKFFSG